MAIYYNNVIHNSVVLRINLFLFAEACIYDKSLGPDTKVLAESNMRALTRMQTVGSKQKSGNSTKDQPLDFNKCKIMEPAVTVTPDQIPVDEGCTFELGFLKNIPTEGKIPALQNRPHSFKIDRSENGKTTSDYSKKKNGKAKRSKPMSVREKIESSLTPVQPKGYSSKLLSMPPNSTDAECLNTTSPVPSLSPNSTEAECLNVTSPLPKTKGGKPVTSYKVSRL